MENCIFCKILKGEIPSKKIFENEYTIAFNDITPQAPVHILVIPRQHYAHIHDIPAENADILSHLFQAVSKIVIQKGLIDNGYRLIINSGRDSGQEVPHIHVHILAGRHMRGLLGNKEG